MKKIILILLFLPQFYIYAQLEEYNRGYTFSIDTVKAYNIFIQECYLNSINDSIINNKIEEVQFNKNGDTTLYSYTSENELNWKDEIHFIYENDRLIRKKVLSYSFIPFFHKGNIYDIKENEKVSIDTSYYFYEYKEKELTQMIWGPSSDSIVNITTYKSKSDRIKQTELFYGNFPENNKTLTYYYNSRKQLDSLVLKNRYDTSSYVYRYDENKRLIYATTELWTLNFDHQDKKFICIRTLGEFTSKITYQYDNKQRIIQKTHFADGQVFYNEFFRYNEYGLIAEVVIEDKRGELTTYSYQYRYKKY